MNSAPPTQDFSDTRLLVALVLARRRRAATRQAPSHSGVPASSPGAGLGRLALLLQPLEGREAHHEPPSAPPICEVSQLDAAALEWLRVSAADGSSADTSAALSAGGVKLLLQLLQGCSLADEPAQEQAHAVARAAPRILERVLSARCAASEAPPDDESDVVRMLSALLQPLTAGVALSCGWLLLAQALLEVLGSDPATGEKTITALAQYGILAASRPVRLTPLSRNPQRRSRRRRDNRRMARPAAREPGCGRAASHSPPRHLDAQRRRGGGLLPLGWSWPSAWVECRGARRERAHLQRVPRPSGAARRLSARRVAQAPCWRGRPAGWPASLAATPRAGRHAGATPRRGNIYAGCIDGARYTLVSLPKERPIW